ncbi:MAG: YlbF family regulator [Oscillospiraceae bacterium]|nr:YlbF family regulator [Oscillospiraceae bacterium]
MTVIELTRQLGAAIQADDRYKAFDAAKKANDADKELNELIGQINLVQLSYQNEAAKAKAQIPKSLKASARILKSFTEK